MGQVELREPRGRAVREDARAECEQDEEERDEEDEGEEAPALAPFVRFAGGVG